MKRFILVLSMAVSAALLLRSQTPTPSVNSQNSGANQLGYAAASKEEQLAIYRNLGKAFYENPTTQQQSVEQFQKALELAPDSVRERVNYGLALLRAGKTADGITKLRKAQQQDPTRSEEHTSEL